MTPRENILAVLGHGKPSFIPCSPHILGINNLPGQLPLAYQDQPMDRLAVSRFVGGTVLYEISASAAIHSGGVSYSKESQGDVTRITLHTPLGGLWGEKKHAKIPTPLYPQAEGLILPGPLETDTQTQFFIKSLEDYPLLGYAWDHTDYAALPEAVSEALTAVGEDGIVVCGASPSPLYHLVSSAAGLERTVYDLYDDPETVETAMDAFFRCAMRQLKAVCDTACDVVRVTEDLDTSLVSPALFERYAFPALKAYADYCHSRGKLLVIHMCGRIRGFLPILSRVGCDAIHCLCPPETGDTPLAEARAAFGQKTAIMARVDPPRLLGETPEALTKTVCEMIDQVGGQDNFMIILPCGRASLANLRAVISTTENTPLPSC